MVVDLSGLNEHLCIGFVEAPHESKIVDLCVRGRYSFLLNQRGVHKHLKFSQELSFFLRFPLLFGS